MRHSAKSLIAAVALFSSGCASLVPTPVVVPDGQAIADYFKTFDGTFPADATPSQILVVGIAYVDNNCETFFNAIESLQQRTTMAQKAMTVGSAQSAVLLNIADQASKSIARVAAVTTITQALVEEYRNQYLFAPHSSAVRRLVSQASEKEAADIAVVAASGVLGSRQMAIFAVQRYARNCTLANIMALWRQSVEVAALRVSPEGIPPPPPPAPPAPLTPPKKVAVGKKTGKTESLSDVERPAVVPGGGLLGIRRYTVQ